MNWLADRLSEPSTHAGIAAILGTAVQFLPPPWGLVAGGLAALFGATAAVKADP